MAIAFKKLQSSDNIATLLSEQELLKIAAKVDSGYKFDEKSRKEWKESNKQAMLIAKQVTEQKTYPWKDAADIKFPLITQAVIDFAAREYPEIIQNDKVVKAMTFGNDPDDAKFKRAQRVGKFMSFQLLRLMGDWEASLDQLLHMLPLLGTVFKKTYYDYITEEVCSEVCHPERIVVNYKARSLDEAARVTHILIMSKNDIVCRMRAGIYKDINCDLLFNTIDYPALTDSASSENVPQFDDKDECEVLEQHCWLDLDGDDYAEPYIVTQHKNTQEILRIISRFKEVKYNKKKQIQCIVAHQYFTVFRFLMSPDGGFYGTGLGTLLLPLNATINSIFNQLIDSGTLSNTQGGFIDSKVRLKNGDVSLKGGEFKVVQVSGMGKLSDYITPLPTKEPSQTLFQLLGLIINASKDLVSNNDLLKGKGETQNVPATTTMAMIEQGLKIYSAITKRLFLALGKEYQKIFELNQEYLKNTIYQEVMDDPMADVSVDFNTSKMDVVPIADPSAATETQRLVRAQTLLSLPGLDPYAVQHYFLESMNLDQEVIDKLLPKPDPNAPPSPEVQKLMAEVAKLQSEAQSNNANTQILPINTQLNIAKSHQEAQESNARIIEAQGRVGKMQHDAATNTAKVQLDAARLESETNTQQGTAVLNHVEQNNLAALQAKELEFKTLDRYQSLLSSGGQAPTAVGAKSKPGGGTDVVTQL
jgi:chaperonin GroES